MGTAVLEPTGSSGAGSVEAEDRIDWVSAIPFLACHAAPLAAFFVTVTWQDWVLCAVTYLVRMFCITAGYHRYFSHRSYKTGRVVQFLLAFGGTTAVQKGPLWWASHHRVHHRFTDLDGDVHSPREGFWWSHVGWILSTRFKDTDLDGIKDFAAYPELRLLERFSWVGPWSLAVVCFLIGGWGGLLIGFFLSTVLLWHATFFVNSLAHIIGRRRYATPDTSRNSVFIAIVTGGEGWHNNHHYLPASVRQGFRWWEFDPTWYALKVLEALHLVRDLRNPPARLLEQARVRDGAFDIGMFRSYWERAAKVTGERIADLTARPLAPSEEASVDAVVPTTAAIDGDSARHASAPSKPEGSRSESPPAVESAAGVQSAISEPLANLSGLISRALESAENLAASTRRRKAPVTSTSEGDGETRSGG